MPEPYESTSADLAAPAALAAFLRGVERRAAVLAELQAGDPTLGDAALTRAMAAFRGEALVATLADWPRLFWSALLQQPALRRARHARPPDFMPACAPPLRAALLLRLAAGLDEGDAAAVLGVDPAQLRRGVLKALACAEGGIDPAAWAALQAQVQQRIRDLPTDRALRLMRMREAALAGPAARFFPTPTAAPRAGWRAPAIAAAMTAIALGGTYVLERTGRDPGISVAALGPAGRPASRFDRDAAIASHPDFALLADPAAERIAADAAFYSWLAAGAPIPATGHAEPDASHPVAADGAESSGAP
ncbi:hypothetical protein [Lysobacter humi (ex Lee et al. 2017)]